MPANKPCKKLLTPQIKTANRSDITVIVRNIQYVYYKNVIRTGIFGTQNFF